MGDFMCQHSVPGCHGRWHCQSPAPSPLSNTGLSLLQSVERQVLRMTMTISISRDSAKARTIGQWMARHSDSSDNSRTEIIAIHNSYPDSSPLPQPSAVFSLEPGPHPRHRPLLRHRLRSQRRLRPPNFFSYHPLHMCTLSDLTPLPSTA
ncbi:hypothetical protein N657DRAFT_205449 [Parathielavia appendiculata]|uniref:Uncharacterized protein n=1 Tax=Parathielavia appendiculata TaxID=2587402 RepID=A0AAN6U968_9PEZI|nr:hypothetical protein N657DRAFT_205449 [Parathielavia appendiculata]